MSLIVLRNAGGTAFSGGIINNVSSKHGTKYAHIALPSADADVVQKMGKRLKEFTVKGIVTGSDAVTFLEGAINGTGSFYFNSIAMNQVLVATTVVHFTDLQWVDTGNRPMERAFTLSFVEIT